MATPKNLLIDVSQDPGLLYVTKRELKNATVAPREITGTSANQPIVINNITSDTRVYLKETVNVPGGTNNEIQINEGGQFVGDSGLRFNPNTDTLTTGSVITNNLTILGYANFGNNLDGYATETYVDDSISAVLGASTGNLRVSGYRLTNDVEDEGNTQFVELDDMGGVTIQSKLGSIAPVGIQGAPGLVKLSGAEIEDILMADPNAVFTITNHGLVSQDKVYITGITTTTELNGLSFYVTDVTTDTFQLNYASNSQPVLSAGLTSWDAGGGIVSAGNNGGDVNITGGITDDNLFGDQGNVNISGDYVQFNATNSIIMNATLDATATTTKLSSVLAPGGLEITSSNENNIDLYTDWQDGSNAVEVYLQHGYGVSIFTNQGSTEWAFGSDGALHLPNYVVQNTNTTVSCQPNMDTVVYTGTTDYQHTFKLLLKIEGVEEPMVSNQWDTQSCEMMVAKSYRDNQVASSVYGVVYTSNAALATFTARWNSGISRVEILCRPTSMTQSVQVRSFVTEMSTSD